MLSTYNQGNITYEPAGSNNINYIGCILGISLLMFLVSIGILVIKFYHLYQRRQIISMKRNIIKHSDSTSKPEDNLNEVAYELENQNHEEDSEISKLTPVGTQATGAIRPANIPQPPPQEPADYIKPNRIPPPQEPADYIKPNRIPSPQEPADYIKPNRIPPPPKPTDYIKPNRIPPPPKPTDYIKPNRIPPPPKQKKTKVKNKVKKLEKKSKKLEKKIAKKLQKSQKK
jgi:hypothetical protein